MAAPSAEQTGSVEARFRSLVEAPEEQIDLAEGALLIAKHADQDLHVERYLARIDELAAHLRARIPSHGSGQERIVALNRFMFAEQGFAPNVEDYYDPRNSFLNQVLDRKVGIPITLSVLYLEVGRRVGLPLHGVAFPGHFLVKCTMGDGVVVLDPYCGGISLRLQDLQQRLREVRGGEVSRAIVANMLVAASKKEILARMLRNLKAIYLQQHDYVHALPALDWILLLHPGATTELRERGLAYLKLECVRAALNDLERYLEMAPAAPDLGEIRSRVIELRRSAARLN